MSLILYQYQKVHLSKMNNDQNPPNIKALRKALHNRFLLCASYDGHSLDDLEFRKHSPHDFPRRHSPFPSSILPLLPRYVSTFSCGIQPPSISCRFRAITTFFLPFSAHPIPLSHAFILHFPSVHGCSTYSSPSRSRMRCQTAPDAIEIRSYQIKIWCEEVG